MSALFIVGNTNERTFANAILAAHLKDLRDERKGLSKVLVLHSTKSAEHLSATKNWREYLLKHGVNPEILINVTVDLQRPGDEPLKLVADHVEHFLHGLDRRDDVYVDLTNGNSFYKSTLANIAFVLGVHRLFILSAPAGQSFPESDFAGPDLLRDSYVALPDPSSLDKVAPAWLTEVRRFSVNARRVAQIFAAIGGSRTADRVGFQGDIENAIQAWFRGSRQDDGPALGAAVMHVGRAYEDLVRVVYRAVFPDSAAHPPDVSPAMDQLLKHLREVAPEYGAHILAGMSGVLRDLRNASTHEQVLPELGRVRARIATELFLAIADIFSILHGNGVLSPLHTGNAAKQAKRCIIEGRRGETYFFGLDGDDTGRRLERLFQASASESDFANFSRLVDEARDALGRKILLAPINGEILFSSGDDILFKGCYDALALDDLRYTYRQVTGVQTCSIGFGRTLKEAYVALKMAKASPGKDAVMGVEIVRLEVAGK